MVPWQERSPNGQPMALDTPAGEELTLADFFEVTLTLTRTLTLILTLTLLTAAAGHASP